MIYSAARLGDHCELITKGTTPTSVGLSFCDEGVPFLRVGNISGGSVNYLVDTLFIDAQANAVLKRSRILPGDVLLSIAGTIGRAGVVPNSAPAMNCNQAVAIIRTRDSIDRHYLRHWLESRQAQAQMAGVTVTGTIQNLSLTQVGELKVPLPPLPEQRRIAAILDRADALSAKRREAFRQLDNLAQSIYIDMFGDPVSNHMRWPELTFDQTVCDETSRAAKTLQSDYLDVGSFPIVDQGQKPVAGYTNDATKLCPCELPVVVFGDHTRAIKLIAFPFAVGADGAKVLSPKPGVSAVYLSHLLRLLPIPNLGYSRHMKELKRLIYPIPPVSLQQTFAGRIQAVESLRAIHRAALAESDALFASLQHRAFAGQLL